MNRALCYDSVNKSLYNGLADTKDCIFPMHDKKGYKTLKFSIPGEPVEIIISSYHHGVSYLYAKILINGKCLLNFHDTQALYILNNCSLDTFQVPAGNWNELFDIIVENYNNLFFISESKIDGYFNELDGIISSENISVFRNKTSQTSTEWEGTFLVMLHSIDKLSNIIKCQCDSVVQHNSFLEKRLLSTCRTFLKRFAECYPTWNKKEGDSRMERFSKELFIVLEYVEKHGKPFEYIDFIG